MQHDYLQADNLALFEDIVPHLQLLGFGRVTFLSCIACHAKHDMLHMV